MNDFADDYMNEPVRYPALQIVDLEAEGAEVIDSYRKPQTTAIDAVDNRITV